MEKENTKERLRDIRDRVAKKKPRLCEHAHEEEVAPLVYLALRGHAEATAERMEACLCPPDVRARTANCAHVVRDASGYLIPDCYETEVKELYDEGYVGKELQDEVERLSIRITTLDQEIGSRKQMLLENPTPAQRETIKKELAEVRPRLEEINKRLWEIRQYLLDTIDAALAA